MIHFDVADELPKFICSDCEITLNHVSEFCEMVKKAQKSLKLQSASIKARDTAGPLYTVSNVYNIYNYKYIYSIN